MSNCFIQYNVKFETIKNGKIISKWQWKNNGNMHVLNYIILKL